MSQYVEVIDAGAGWTKVRTADGQELMLKGTRAWRNNNPGNIEYGDFAKSRGAIGTDGRFAVFPDYDTGRGAKESLLFDSKGYSGLTVDQAINRYAPPSENNTNSYIDRVANAAGVTANTPLSDMTPSQRSAMLDAMQVVEGWKSGTVTPGGIQMGYSPIGQFPDNSALRAISGMEQVPFPRPRPVNTGNAYMDALQGKFAASGGFEDIGMFPRFSDLKGLNGRTQLPSIGPTGGGSQMASDAPKGLFGGLTDLLGKGKEALQGAADNVADVGVAAGGAIRNKINPLQAIAGVFANQLPDNNAGQAIRAAMGFRNPNVGMSLGKAANGGEMIQGVNGVMNSTTQNSQAWQQMTGQEPRYTYHGDGSFSDSSGGVYYERHLK